MALLLHRIRSRVEIVFPVVLGLLLGLLVCTEVLQVLGRYFFGFSFTWVQDILLLTLLLIGWLGSAYLWFKKEHLSVEIIRIKPSVVVNWIHPISDLVVVLVVVCLLPSVAKAMQAYSGLRLDGLDVSASVKFLPCFVGMLLLGVGAVINLMDYAIARSKPRPQNHA